MELTSLEDCPPVQDISRFVDGLVVGEEKKLLIAHFDVCPVCYETLTGTLETQEEFPDLFEKKKPADILEFKPTRTQQFIKKLQSTRKNIAYVIAASVVGTIGYQTLQHQLHLLRTPSAYSIAHVINTEVQSLTDRPRRLRFRGLAGSTSKQKKENIFFDLGRRLTNIEVSLHRNNRNNLEEDLEILEEMEVVPQIRKPFEEFSNELRLLKSSENNLKTKIGITDNLIEKIKDSAEINHLRLGSWLEGIIIGLRSQPPLVPEIEASEFFIDQLSEENAKPKLIEQLKALNQLLSDTGDKYNADVLINAVNKLMSLHTDLYL
jgi:hypothetical protein